MRLLSIGQPPNLLQIGLIVSAVLVSIVAGAAYMVFDTAFSPLIIAGVILGILSALIWVRMPVVALYTALLVVLLPIGLFPANVQSYLNRLLTIAAFVVWGVCVIVRGRRIVWTNTVLLMLGFLVWCLLTLLWAQNLEAAKNELGGYALRFVLFLFLITNEISTGETLNGLMRVLAIVGWVFIVAGMGTIISQGYEVGTRLRILETNENTLGGLFPLVVVGVIWLAIRTPKRRRALWYFLSLAFISLSFALIALSGSRGGAITWVITILFLLFWRQTRVWGIVGLLILAAAVIMAPLILATTIDRFADRTNDTLLGGREALWQAAWLLIRNHPLAGVGVGNAPNAMMSYIRLFRSAWGNESAVVHNPILTIWVEIGLPGLLLYLSVLASSVWSFVREYAYCRKMDVQWLMPYFALTASAFLGYCASWIKGGGMELSFSYFLMMALLLVPSHLESSSFNFEHI